MSVIPTISIISKFYVHLVMLGVSIILLQFMGFFVNIYYLQLIYVIFSTFCLLLSISLITSTLSTIIRDVHMLLNSVLRMLLYLSGVLWPIALLADFPFIMKVMMLNPLFYLIEGYRYALFGIDWHFIAMWPYTLFFWAVVIVLFLIGSSLHVKFRRHFIDYL